MTSRYTVTALIPGPIAERLACIAAAVEFYEILDPEVRALGTGLPCVAIWREVPAKNGGLKALREYLDEAGHCDMAHTVTPRPRYYGGDP